MMPTLKGSWQTVKLWKVERWEVVFRIQQQNNLAVLELKFIINIQKVTLHRNFDNIFGRATRICQNFFCPILGRTLPCFKIPRLRPFVILITAMLR